jgi:valyl-tRNA synthetase
MSLEKRFKPKEAEARLMARWERLGVHEFSPETPGEVYSIDTPPPTVSGRLHLGHVYSYSHPDFVARFWRMRGRQVFYPMGFDDNGLPTDRLVEQRLGVTAQEVGREAFIQKCLEVSEQAEEEYQALWQRLGLSIDWRYTYRTIDERSRRTSQLSFLELYRRGLVYRQEAPVLWCPECHTAIAQAELDDLERESEYVTLAFRLEDDSHAQIATTRPELLPACVAVFVHPDDERHRNLVGKTLEVPLFGQKVPVLADREADPGKGTGVVMCCTFGDSADVAWWYKHKLPLVQALDRQGRMSAAGGGYAGLRSAKARREIKAALSQQGLILERQATAQSVRVHERCDTPVEYMVESQWFTRVLDFKDELIEAGEQVNWHPGHMKARYRAWVENLNWDWCISRQRYFGVMFPLWYCEDCGEVIPAEEAQLPVDPGETAPPRPCGCGGTQYRAEEDVMDTWATSSLTPQIVGQWLEGEDGKVAGLYERVYPFSMRAQAHEIIRTWAFYTIVKSHFHFGSIPWKDVFISGWGIAGEGAGKISKSRGGGPMPPLEMIERYSADSLRYWAASTGPGKDAVISEEKIKLGAKLINKLWNVARFSGRFIEGYYPPKNGIPPLSPADRWILARVQILIRRATELLEGYEYAAAKSEIETFFWRELADNYLEMAKQRLYDEQASMHEGARYTLQRVILTTLKLFAPFLPYVTEEIFLGTYQPERGGESIHTSPWPEVDPALEDQGAIRTGELLVMAATAVRRYKSENNLSLGSKLERLQLAVSDDRLAPDLAAAADDLSSITRARHVEVCRELDKELISLETEGENQIAIETAEPT